MTSRATTAAVIPRWKDYLSLSKPEISFLVAISSLAGFMLGSPGEIAWGVLAWTMIGTVLAAAGGGALNHVLERGYDAEMRRTADRPLPSGRVSTQSATVFGVVLVCAGVGILCPLVNPLTGVLAALTVALYLFVYTPLKRVSTLNTYVGTLPGALPALGGWTAATGDFGAAGWAIFGVLLFWQLPHFYALAWMYRADYARANYAMLPVVQPDGRSTVTQIIIFSVLMVATSIVPTVLGATSMPYAIAALLLGVWFFGPVIRFARDRSNGNARKLLKATIYYIPMLVVFIVADRLISG